MSTTDTPTDTSRQAVLGELLDELTSHTPAGVMRHMRRWPSGPLSLVHLNVLMVLAEDGGLPMRVLAESLDVSQASATGIVDRMEQRGLVERRRDDEDRRVIRVALTDAGRQLIAGLASERRGHLAALLDGLTDEELDGLLRGTRALRVARERRHAQLAEEHAAPGAPDPLAAPGHPVLVHQPEPSPAPTPHSSREASR